jgi:hypothetical protein
MAESGDRRTSEQFALEKDALSRAVIKRKRETLPSFSEFCHTPHHSDDSCPSGSHQDSTTNHAVDPVGTELQPTTTQQRKFVYRQRRPDRQMILAIFQSTMPAREVSGLLLAFEKSSPKIELVSLNECDLVRYRNTTHTSGDPAILVSQRCLDSLPDSKASRHGSNEFYDGPLHYIPVSRWTKLVATSEDGSASRLVYLFLKCLNPYWRLVEEDLFLQASRVPGESPYCSSFLVNAMLACASLYSDTDIAFARFGHHLTRGSHYHDAASRLWISETQCASLCNV